MAVITINGNTFSGNNLSIVNGVMLIDGKVVDDENKDKTVTIILEGVTDVYSDQSLQIKGDVKGNVNASGSVNCDSVGGNVMAENGSVHCDDVGCSVAAGGSVNCDDIDGNVQAGGSVRADNIYNKS